MSSPGTACLRPPACCCSTALLVKPCLRLFASREPEVGALILTFLAFVFSLAFT